MHIEILKSKIHRVTVTQAELHYTGSITVGEDLLDAANLAEKEQVTAVNINNKERFKTYANWDERSPGTTYLSGPTAWP